MSLPLAARERLAAPLQTAISAGFRLRDQHIVPLASSIWAEYSDELVSALKSLESEVLSAPGSNSTFGEFQRWVADVLDRRKRTLALVRALQPFVHFDHDNALRTAEMVDQFTKHAAQVVQQGTSTLVHVGGLDSLCDRWSDQVSPAEIPALREVFNLDTDPLDENGEFKPSRVFRAYKYDNQRLLQQMTPHFDALGIPMVID